MSRKKKTPKSDSKNSSRGPAQQSPRASKHVPEVLATCFLLAGAFAAFRMQYVKPLAVRLGFTSARATASVAANNVTLEKDSGVCTSDGSNRQTISMPSFERSLKPSDLPEPVVFTSFEENTTVTLPNGIKQKIAPGKVFQINNFDSKQDDVLIDFAVMPEAMNRSSVEDMLKLLRAYEDWDDDPDTVDGMATHEMFISNPELYREKESIKFRDVDSKFVPARKILRKKLTDIVKPYLDNVITPMVHQRYPSACTSKGYARQCTPCYSLIRKYKHGQRQSHATHNDGHAIVTVVVSLSDYNVNYRGGLYVSTGFGQQQHVALNKGDAVMHQSSLLHGVKVYDIHKNPKKTERWSWILWYRDSRTCDDYGHEWFKECADAGDPTCQHLDSTKVGKRPGISPEEVASQVLELNLKAADGGSGIAAVKVARAYMHQLPSALLYDTEKAAQYYHRAIQSHNPDGHYGLALIDLLGVTNDYKGGRNEMSAYKDYRVGQAIDHLEKAAFAGHAFAMFNLGLVHTFGYVNGTIDTDLAGEWFEASGLPEGYFVAANAAAASGNKKREKEMMKRAEEMGFFAPWRTQARQNTGSGGAGGVDLNMPWPPAFDGRRPPDF